MYIYMYDRRVCGVAQDLHRGYILVWYIAKKSMCISMYDRRVCGVAQDLHRGYILVLLVGTFFYMFEYSCI